MVNKAIPQFFFFYGIRKLKYITELRIWSKEQGDIDLPDFQIIDDAFKVVWVRR